MYSKTSKIKLIIFVLIFSTFLVFNGYSQGLPPPSEGKSAVYFVRYNPTGALINFKFFDGENYLGKFNGTKYFVYECDPGKHVFWAASENRSFLEADLESGKVYIIEARPTTGAIKAGVKLIPVAPDNAKGMKNINKLIAKKGPFDLDSKDFSDEAEDLGFFISNGMKKYHSDKEKDKAITQLPANYFHN